MAQIAELTPDGWIVTDLRAFQTLTGQDPPRRWGYWDQVKSDVHESKLIWLWVRALFFTAAGVSLSVIVSTTNYSLFLLGLLMVFRGLWLIGVWIMLANSVIRQVRAEPIAFATLTGLEPQPSLGTIFEFGQATRPTGEIVSVAIEAPLANAIKHAGFPAEIMFIDAPNSILKSVFAGRPKK